MVAPGGVCKVALVGACVVAPGGHAWLLRGGRREGHAWLLQGGVHGCSRGVCMVAPREGGHAWLLQGWHAWFYLGGMHGFIWGAWFYSGGMRGFIWGGMHVFFSFFGYNEIRSMSGRYASY